MSPFSPKCGVPSNIRHAFDALPVLEVQRRLSIQRMTSELNNGAAQMFMACQDATSMALYQQCVSLLNKFIPKKTSADDPEHASDNNADTLLLHIRSRDPSVYFLASETHSLFQPLLIPVEEDNREEHQELEALCGDELLATIILFNLGLLLQKNGLFEEALQFMSLAYNLAESEFQPGALHPTFSMVVAYHMAEMTHACGQTQEAWNFFLQAVEIGKHSLPHDFLFAAVCTRFGGLLLEDRYLEEAETVFLAAGTIYEKSAMHMATLADAGTGNDSANDLITSTAGAA
jgi:tetratricopeptide (TPR) repeat protein